jgi:hypothetical protein
VFGDLGLAETQAFDNVRYLDLATRDCVEYVPAHRVTQGIENIGCCRCPSHATYSTYRYGYVSMAPVVER